MQLLDTPNPNAKKLLIKHDQVTGENLNLKNFQPDQIEYKLLNLDGIDSIFVGPDFYTLLKNNDSDWNAILKDINNILDKI